MMAKHSPLVSRIVVSALGAGAAFTVACSNCAAAPSDSASSKVVKELQPVIGDVNKADCPVYLPTWIPELNKQKFAKGYLFDSTDIDFPHGYEVAIGSDKQMPTYLTNFYMHGGVGSVKGKHPVKLNGGRTGFLKHALIEWNQGKYKYGIGFVDARVSNADMIKTANSVVLIPSAKPAAAPSKSPATRSPSTPTKSPETK